MRVALVVAALLIGTALLWGAGELHYRSCLDAAEAKYPADRVTQGDFFDEEVAAQLRQRDAAIDDCSRLPW